MTATEHDNKQRVFFDLHCDTITECMRRECGLTGNHLHISLERFPKAYRLIQCMAIFVHDRYRGREARAFYRKARDTFRQQLAQHSALAGSVRAPGDIQAVLENKQFGLMLTVEGGGALAGELEAVEELFADGVRMMTLTWNGINELCGGCATEEGFTPFGRRAVAEMERLGMVVDVSHLSDKGFWELSGFAEKPFVASHSNARAVCGHRRNLTDEMFREIAKRGGLVGINYYDEFIAPQGNTHTIDDLLAHILHFLELGGEDTLALGSDYDGAEIPAYLDGFQKVGSLAEAMERAGIGSPVVDKILFGNANRFFNQYMGVDAQ